MFDICTPYLENLTPKDNTYKPILTILCIITIIIWIKVVLKFIKHFKNIKSTWQYHGAEHKVIITNYEKKEINLENCKKASRISDNCGTMLVVIFFFILILIKIIQIIFKSRPSFTLSIIVPFILTYELFLLKRDTPIISLLFKLGYFLQEHFFTLEPTDDKLTQAIEAFKLLEDAETGKIPDSQIKELLTRNKKILF